MVIDLKQRTLEKLAHCYSLKNKSRSMGENWLKAKDFLIKLDKRYNRLRRG